MIREKTHPWRMNNKPRRRLPLALLSLMLALFTAASLTLPALTLENEPSCGLAEHQHGEECYMRRKVCEYGEDTDEIGTAVLICTQEESEDGHRHGEECYHIHTEECFETELSCTIPEHSHEAACYASGEPEAEGELTPIEEATPTPESIEREEEAEYPIETLLPEEENVRTASARKAPLLGGTATATRELTLATVQLSGATLSAGQFTFRLYEGTELIDEATNDASGNISFSLPISGAGIYHYTVLQLAGTEAGYSYDTAQYPLTIAIEDNSVISGNFRSDLYYGLTVRSSTTSLGMTYRFYMSPQPGGRDYRVLCIDHSAKQAPSTVTEEVYWVAEVDPSESMILACVCNTSGTSSGAAYTPYDNWSSPLTENLRKLLYSLLYGSNSGMTDLEKQTLAWQISQGLSSVSNTNYSTIMKIINGTTVPDAYKLVLFHPSDGSFQSFVTLLPASSLQSIRTERVAFANSYTAPSPSPTPAPTPIPTPTPDPTGVTALITARKTLNDAAPGSAHIYSFELLDAEGRVLQTMENDADGSIRFEPLLFTRAGSYTYTLREVNDGQNGIIYDPEPRNVTVVVTETASGTPTDFDFTAGSYYSLTSDDDDESKYFYLSTAKGGRELTAYCIDASKDFPPLAYDLSTGYDLTKYSVVQDPSNAQLESSVGRVKSSGRTEENLRKLLYYIDQHPELSREKKNALVWTATSAAYDFYTIVSQSELDAIYAATTVPDNYHLALFYPSELGGTRASYASLDDYQPLLAGYYGTDSALTAELKYEDGEILFRNRSGFEIPETGGGGTGWLLLPGVLLMLLSGSVLTVKRFKTSRETLTRKY